MQNTFYSFLLTAQLSTVLLSWPSAIACEATTRCNSLLLSSPVQLYKLKPCLHLPSLPPMATSWSQPLPRVCRLKTPCTMVILILT